MDWMNRRLASLLLTRESFTSDDITKDGSLAADMLHEPNGRQNAIGATFRAWANNGLIVGTGTTVKSRAKHRKGGRIQVWRPTDRGRDWARTYYKSERRS